MMFYCIHFSLHFLKVSVTNVTLILIFIPLCCILNFSVRDYKFTSFFLILNRRNSNLIYYLNFTHLFPSLQMTMFVEAKSVVTWNAPSICQGWNDNGQEGMWLRRSEQLVASLRIESISLDIIPSGRKRRRRITRDYMGT